MQQRPTKTALLEAIAKFLVGEVYPRIADKRLNFRVLIAANLANMVAAELDSEATIIDAEIARLAELMPDAAPDRDRPISDAEQRQLVLELNRELAARIRKRRLSAQERQRAWDHAKETLIRTLAIDNPRFDTSAQIE
jgi:hypothetical protein